MIWFSKPQNTVEYSSFGYKFVASRIAMELLISLRYKLRLYGVPVDGPINFFSDNHFMTKNVTLTQSVMNNSHNAIFYHRVHGAQSIEIIRVGWIQGEYNQSYLVNNITLSTKRSHVLVNTTMWNYAVKILN